MKKLFEQVEAKIVSQEMKKMRDTYGGGDTTLLFFCEAIFREGIEWKEDGVDPVMIKGELDKALPLAVKNLEKRTFEELSKGLGSEIFKKVLSKPFERKESFSVKEAALRKAVSLVGLFLTSRALES